MRLRTKAGPLCALCGARASLYSVRREHIGEAVAWLRERHGLPLDAAAELEALLHGAGRFDCRRKLCSSHHFQLSAEYLNAWQLLALAKSSRDTFSKAGSCMGEQSNARLCWKPIKNLERWSSQKVHKDTTEMGSIDKSSTDMTVHEGATVASTSEEDGVGAQSN